MDGRTHALLSFPPYANKLRPAGGHIYCHQGIQVKTIHTFSTLGYQINLDKSRTLLLPIRNGKYI
jgi:hypothetical protein